MELPVYQGAPGSHKPSSPIQAECCRSSKRRTDINDVVVVLGLFRGYRVGFNRIREQMNDFLNYGAVIGLWNGVIYLNRIIGRIIQIKLDFVVCDRNLDFISQRMNRCFINDIVILYFNFYEPCPIKSKLATAV